MAQAVTSPPDRFIWRPGDVMVTPLPEPTKPTKKSKAKELRLKNG
jgi:hypothetical protein